MRGQQRSVAEYGTHVKQADLVLALHVCGESFTPEQKLANFDYYEPLTVRDSSLSACTQAVVAAEVGHLDQADGCGDDDRRQRGLGQML